MAVTVTVHTSKANPAPINLTQEFPVGSMVCTGQATNISLTLDDARGCRAALDNKEWEPTGRQEAELAVKRIVAPGSGKLTAGRRSSDNR